jgi:hypothetical protein
MNKPENFPEHVWIGEAWHDNERIERVVHLNYNDCEEDLHTCVDVEDYTVEFEKERLYTGDTFIEEDKE